LIQPLQQRSRLRRPRLLNPGPARLGEITRTSHQERNTGAPP